MPHRIFLALPISEELQNEILAWEQKFQNLPVRWLKGKNLHITLIPPWYEDDTAKIVTWLHGLKNTANPFELNFTKVTFGPNPRQPRLIWAEGPAPTQLVQLKSILEQTLNFKPESRTFHLHLTLARFRPEKFRSFPVKSLNETIYWQDMIRSFVLMESHLHPTGAEYEVLAVIPL